MSGETCAVCGKGTALIVNDGTISFFKNGKLIKLNDVTLYRCNYCEDEYFSPQQIEETTKRLNAIP